MFNKYDRNVIETNAWNGGERPFFFLQDEQGTELGEKKEEGFLMLHARNLIYLFTGQASIFLS